MKRVITSLQCWYALALQLCVRHCIRGLCARDSIDYPMDYFFLSCISKQWGEKKKNHKWPWLLSALRWLVMPLPSRGDAERIEGTYQMALLANKRSMDLWHPQWVAIKALEMNHSIDSSTHKQTHTHTRLQTDIHQGSILGSVPTFLTTCIEKTFWLIWTCFSSLGCCVWFSWFSSSLRVGSRY